MNKQAERHLAKAAGFLAKGEDFYRKAAAEIVAAQEADPTLSNREIGATFNRSDDWVRKIVSWSTTSEPGDPIDWKRGNHGERAAAKKYFAEASLEEVERVLDAMPVSRRAKIATALVSEGDVAEAIHADPEASKVHLRMTDAIVGQAVDRGTERGRRESRTTRDIDASRHYSDAAKEMADGNAIIFAHSPEGEALDRCDAAVSRVKQHVETYEEIRGLVH